MSSSEQQEKINVKTKVFEGPLELLLNLIEKRKLFVNDISLAEVTEDYIDYVNSQRVFPLSQASHFINISSTLLLIKSKSLIPDMELTREEESDIEDLGHRVQLHKFFKSLSRDIKKKFGSQILFRRNLIVKEPVFSPDEKVRSEELKNAAYRVINNLSREEKMKEVVVERTISLDEVISNLRSRITSSLQMSFNGFSGRGKRDKTEVILSFMALLELIKSGTIMAFQEDNFSDILMESKEVSTPRYESE